MQLRAIYASMGHSSTVLPQVTTAVEETIGTIDVEDLSTVITIGVVIETCVDDVVGIGRITSYCIFHPRKPRAHVHTVGLDNSDIVKEAMNVC